MRSHTRRLPASKGTSSGTVRGHENPQHSVVPKMLIGRLPSMISEHDDAGWRVHVSHFLYSPLMELLTTVMIFMSFFLIIQDTDVRAKGESSPSWNAMASDCCFMYFVLEFSARVFVERTLVFRETWNRIDFLVVAVGLIELTLKFAMGSSGADKSMNMVRIFRVVRVLRLLRVLKVMKTFNELWKMVKMLATCGRTLFWAFVLAFLITTIWSVVLVEFVAPLVSAMERDRGVWDGDDLWINAYSSVMRSNLSLFQTIIAGDSWGRVPVPIIEVHPWTALIFVPAHVVLFFGVMNLIIAVVVETFADIRERNRKTLSEEKEEQERLETVALTGLFESIDTDRNGTVTLDELEIAAASVPALQQRLQIFGIKGKDLVQLFDVLDENNDGGVDMDEFIEVFCRMKCGDTRATTTLVKAYVMDLVRQTRQTTKDIANIKRSLGALPVEDSFFDPQVEGEPSHDSRCTSNNVSFWRASDVQRLSTSTSEEPLAWRPSEPSNLRLSVPTSEAPTREPTSEPREPPCAWKFSEPTKFSVPEAHTVEDIIVIPRESYIAHLSPSPPPGGPSAKALAFPRIDSLIAGANLSRASANPSQSGVVQVSAHVYACLKEPERPADSAVETTEVMINAMQIMESQEELVQELVI